MSFFLYFVCCSWFSYFYVYVYLMIMPKLPMILKIVAYDKADKFFAERYLYVYKYSEAFKEFNKFVELFTTGQFSYIGRIDLVDSRRILFSVVSLRHVVNQINYSINFKPF